MRRFIILVLLSGVCRLAYSQDTVKRTDGKLDSYISTNIVLQNEEYQSIRAFSIGYWFLPELKASLDYYSNVDAGRMYSKSTLNERALSLMIASGFNLGNNFEFVSSIGPGMAWAFAPDGSTQYRLIGDLNVQWRYYYAKGFYVGLQSKVILRGRDNNTASFLGITFGDRF